MRLLNVINHEFIICHHRNSNKCHPHDIDNSSHNFYDHCEAAIAATRKGTTTTSIILTPLMIKYTKEQMKTKSKNKCEKHSI